MAERKGGFWRAVFRAERVVGAVVLFVLLGVRLFDPVPVQSVRLGVFDAFQRVQPRAIEDSVVTIAAIDEASMAEFGQWPWPRTVLAALVDRLTDAGAAVIAFDIFFTEADRISSDRLTTDIPGLQDTLRAARAGGTSNDQALADAMRRGKVVLAMLTSRDRPGGSPRARLEQAFAVHARDGVEAAAIKRYLPTSRALVRAIPVLEEAAAGNGVAAFWRSRRGFIERVPMIVQVADDDKYYSFSMEIVRVFKGKKFAVWSFGPAGLEFAGVVGVPKIPTDKRGQIWLHFAREGDIPSVSVRDVLAGSFDDRLVKDRIVIVGAMAGGLDELYVTPTRRSLYGVQVHAQAVDSILSGTALLRAAWVEGGEWAFLLVMGILALVVFPAVAPAWSLALFLAAEAGFAALSWLLFESQGMLFDATAPAATVLVLYMVSVVAAALRAPRRS